jgi:hypothetical protein
MSIDELTIYVIYYGALVANAYPILYAIRSPWRSSNVGRALMTKAVAIAALFDISIVNLWWAPYPGYRWVYLAVVTFVAIAITRLLSCSPPSTRAGTSPPPTGSSDRRRQPCPLGTTTPVHRQPRTRQPPASLRAPSGGRGARLARREDPRAHAGHRAADGRHP